MESSAHQGSVFRQRISVLCREILLDCKTLLGNFLRHCTDAAIEHGLSTCNDSCNSLKGCVMEYETTRNEKKVALLEQIEKLVRTLNKAFDELKVLNPGSENARELSQNLKQDIVDITKLIISLAKELEEQCSHEPQQQIDAKERCINILESLSLAIDRQDRDGWKDTAKQLAQEVQYLIRTYYHDHVYSPLILQSVLDLVRESHLCFKGEDPQDIIIFKEHKARVIDLILSTKSEKAKEIREVQQQSEVTPDNMEETDEKTKKNKKSDSLSDDSFGESSTDGFSSSAESTNVRADSEDTSDERVTLKYEEQEQNNSSQDADNLLSVSPSPRINALIQKALYQSNIAQNIFNLIVDMFPEKELPELEQEHLKKELSHIISNEVKNGSNPPPQKVHKKLPSISGEGESPRILVENVPNVHNTQEPVSLSSSAKSTTNRINDKRLELSKRIKEKKKAGAALTLNLIKKKDKKQATLEFTILDSLDGDSITTKFSREIRELITSLLSEVTNFVESYKNITIQLEEKKVNPAVVNNNTHLPKIQELTKNIILVLSKTLDLVPNEILVQPEGQDELSLIKTFNRVKASISREVNVNILELDNEKLTEGFYLPLMKKNLLESIVFRCKRSFFCTSQFLSCLCSFEEHLVTYLYLLSLTDSMDKIVRAVMDDIQTFYHLLDVENHLRIEDSKKKKKLPKIPKKKSDSVWKDEGNTEDNDPNNRFRAGTLNNLIIRLTGSVTEKEFLNSFLNGYPSFTTPSELFEKLVDRYSVPKNIPKDQSSFIKMRVVNVILQWIKRDFHLLDHDLIQQIKKFCEKTLSKDQPDSKGKSSETTPAGRIMKELMEDKRYTIKKFEYPPKEITIYQTEKCTYRIILQFDESQIAEQLTLIELEIFQKIDATELVGLKWSKPKLQLLSQNLLFLIHRVNQLSFWVSFIILSATSIKRRVKVLAKMINIAKHLSDNHNYNSLMGILNGLSLSPISRLKHTWELLNKDAHKVFQQYKSLEELQSPMNAFKSLRDSMKSAKSKVLPYLATFLSDLTLVEENQDYVTRGEAELINFNKHYLQSTAIKNLLMYQKSLSLDTNTKLEPLFTFLYELPSMEEKELFALSQELEPRGSELKNILAKDNEK